MFRICSVIFVVNRSLRFHTWKFMASFEFGRMCLKYDSWYSHALLITLLAATYGPAARQVTSKIWATSDPMLSWL